MQAGRIRVLASIAILALLVALGCQRANEAPASPIARFVERPDVLLVVLDTVRADRSSAYGYERPTTQFMAQVAERGVLFEDVTASGPWTVPSHASLFTGVPPWVHGAHLVGDDEGGISVVGMRVRGLGPELPTLAERFSAAGYHTRAFSANDWLGPDFGLMRGFDELLVIPKDQAVVNATLELLDALEETDDRPLFLFVNLMAAHAPYHSGRGEWAIEQPSQLERDKAPDWLVPFLKRNTEAPAVLLQEQSGPAGLDGLTRYMLGELAIPPEGFELFSQLYDTGVHAADSSFAHLLLHFRARRPGGIVAVTSDHGEALGEHGLLDHRSTVYPEVLRVPLAIEAPGRIPAGLRVSEPTQLSDLSATLLALAGIDSDGESLPGLQNGAEETRPIEAAAWPVTRWQKMLGGRFARRWHLYREGQTALVWSDRGDLELYDLQGDPGMQNDLADSELERARALHGRALPRFAEATRKAVDPVELSPELRERLEAIGYGN